MKRKRDEPLSNVACFGFKFNLRPYNVERSEAQEQQRAAVEVAAARVVSTTGAVISHLVADRNSPQSDARVSPTVVSTIGVARAASRRWGGAVG